jgi:hypothetical protein
MTTAFFSSFAIRNIELETVAHEYEQWVLGKGRFRRARQGRIRNGIPNHLSAEAMRGSGDFSGENEYSLSIRRSSDTLLLRLRERDTSDGSVFWRNFVRLRSTDSGVLIEHAINRSVPRGISLSPMASSPSVVQEIISSYSNGVYPRDLYTARIVCCDEAAVDAFVEHVLLDTSRVMPLLVLTPTRAGLQPIDSVAIAKKLRGMATVVELSSYDCVEALTEAMMHRGFDKQYSCFDGGARLYGPQLSTNDHLYLHPLWIRARLFELSGDTSKRTEVLAGLVVLGIADAHMPADLATCVDDFDRQERRRRAEEALAVQPPNPQESMEEFAERTHSRIYVLESELRKASELIEVYDVDNRDRIREIEDAKSRISQLEYESQQGRLKAEALEQQLEEKVQGGNDSIPVSLRNAFSSLLNDSISPESVLLVVAAIWPEELVVLESAFKSSRKSASFKFGKTLLEQLSKLASKYRDGIIRGGDSEARKVFGKGEYAATESETVMNSDAAMKRRTFSYKGKKTRMLAHLKIGTKDSVAETLRTHFHWDATILKIVIGYCGPHLDFD